MMRASPQISAGMVGLLLLGLSACAAGPDFHAPAQPAGMSYGLDPVDDPVPSVRLTTGAPVPEQWWTSLQSPAMDALVETALRNNPSIEAARQALGAARELTAAQRGAYFPQVGVNISPSHQSYARTLASPAQSGASVYDLTTSQVSVGFAPDVFGANRRAVEALAAQQDQARYELEAAQQALAANVVVAAVTDAQLGAQISETRRLVDIQRAITQTIEQQLALGQSSRADLLAQKALLAQTEAGLPALERQRRLNRDLLAALLGATPGEVALPQLELDGLVLPAELPVRLPAEVVRHRPDVRTAEAALHVASAQVGVAVAARLPSVQIDGSAGSAALHLVPGFGPGTSFWAVTGSITQPVFAGGQLWRRQKAAEAAFKQAGAVYRSTVIGAVQNTADALHALLADARTRAAADAQDEAARGSLNIARRQLALGDVSAVAVLQAEMAERQARLTVIQAHAAQLADVAALYLALGGDWKDGVAAQRPAGARGGNR